MAAYTRLISSANEWDLTRSDLSHCCSGCRQIQKKAAQNLTANVMGGLTE